MKIRTVDRRKPEAGPVTPVATGGELRALTGLRIVAAVWVVAFHFHFTALPGVADVTGLLGPLVTQGALGVDLFFVLSGFVIAHTYLDRLGSRPRPRAVTAFVWARAARMWPAYVVVFHLFGIWLLARTLLGSDGDIAFQAVQPRLSWGEWLQQLLLVQMWDERFLDGSSWVGSTWSVSAEWLAYLLFPLTALVFFRLRRLPAAVLATGALAMTVPVAASFVVAGSPYYPFSWVVRVLCGFCAGVLALLAVRRIGERGLPGTGRTASVTAGLAGVGIVVALVAGGADGGGSTGVAVALFPVLVGALALADRYSTHGGPARWLAAGPLVHGGRISYALYLVHIPVFEVFWTALQHGALRPGAMSTHLVALAVLVGTVPLAHLLFVLVERPGRRWMRRPVWTAPRLDRADEPASTPDAGGPVDTARARLDPVTVVLPVQAPGSDPVSATALPSRRAGRIGSRSGAERCGRGRHVHRAHGSAATPIVVAAAASAPRDRRPSHGLPHRGRR